MEKDNIHSIRNCKSRMDFVGSAVLLLIPIITLEIIGVLKTTISFFVLGNIIIWGIYLFLLWALIRECTSGIVNQNGVEIDRKSTRLNSSHIQKSRMPSSA